MKNKLLLMVFFLTISQSLYAQPGWIQQNSNVSSDLYSIHFIDTQTGWCVGDNGSVLKTNNGGTNWIDIPTGYPNNFRDITFTSSYNGYITGDLGLLLRTTNSGVNWNDISFRDGIIREIFFINENNGYLTAEDAEYLFKTTNGGASWDSVNLMFPLKNVFFINESTGWVSGSFLSGDVVYKTIDGGSNWLQQFFIGNSDKIESIFFADAQNGWIGSPKYLGVPTIYRTTNGGTNWIQSITGGMSYSIYFNDANKGWCAGENGMIFHTTNTGSNWTSQTALEQGMTFRSISFADPLNGWCAGNDGRILRTTTGGVLTGFTNSNAQHPDHFSLSQNYPNPFNPSTIINYNLPSAGMVSIKVFDVNGKEVSTVLNEYKDAGYHRVQLRADGFSSGIYFYRLTSGNFVQTRKMMVLK